MGRKENEEGYFTVLPRACLLSPRDVESSWLSHFSVLPGGGVRAEREGQ